MKTLKGTAFLLVIVFAVPIAWAQSFSGWQDELPAPKHYRLKRISSADPTGGNADFRTIEPGATLTLLDEKGPGLISHIWITIASDEPYHLKKLVLRIFWDDESEPSVETPIGDFFGLGTATTSCTSRCLWRWAQRKR